MYNEATARAIRLACSLFDRRGNLSDIREITTATILRFKDETLSVANAYTYNGYLAYIKVVLRWGEKEYGFNADQIYKLKKAPVSKAKKKVVDDADYRSIIAQLRSDSDLVPCSWFWLIVIRFIYSVGLRRRQIVELQISDLDFINSTILLRTQGSKTRKEWHVPMIDSIRSDLRYLMEAIEYALKRPLKPSDKAFNICYFNSACTPDPKDPTRMRVRYITEIFRTISKKTQAQVGAHRLRHTTATHLCNPVSGDESPDIFFAQYALGHSDIRTTEGYVEINMSYRKEHMEKYLQMSGIGKMPRSRTPNSSILSAR